MDALQRSRSKSVVALVAVVALIVGLVGVGVAISNRDDPSAPTVPDTSPVLNLSRTSTEGRASTASGGTYQLDGTLGTTTEEGVVIDPGTSTASKKQVRDLVAALGMRNPRIEQVKGQGWTATGKAAGQKAAFALDQKPGNAWQYARGPLAACLSIAPGAAPADTVSCAANQGSNPSGPAAGSTRGPTRAALLREAKDVFALVGITPGTGLAAHEDGKGTTYLDVPITVEGLPVVDATVSVSVDSAGITSASGWLDPTFTTVGRYPLVSATDAFANLSTGPRPASGRVCPSASPEASQEARSGASSSAETGSGIACDPLLKVTAARLAWLVSRQAEQPLLVPAWQFEVDGFYGPAVVAIAPQFLGTQ